MNPNIIAICKKSDNSIFTSMLPIQKNPLPWYGDRKTRREVATLMWSARAYVRRIDTWWSEMIRERNDLIQTLASSDDPKHKRRVDRKLEEHVRYVDAKNHRLITEWIDAHNKAEHARRELAAMGIAAAIEILTPSQRRTLKLSHGERLIAV